MHTELASAFMGRSVPRLEDAKLLRGAGRFVDDIDLPHLLHATFVRSSIAHGLLQRVDIDKARVMPGIRAVLTYADLRPVLTCDRIPLALPVPALRFHVDPCILARQEVCYVGEPVALVVAESRQQAEDAAALVELDLRPLPAVLEPRAGLEPGAPRARLDCSDNLVAHWVVEYGDVGRAFAGAPHRISEHFRIHKGGGHSIEARGVLARYDAIDELLTVWDSTQMPHKTKRVLVEALGLSEQQVRVIAPDVGGGFGPKNPFYPEELAIPAAALVLGRPVKWVEDRRECFTATNHEREQDWEMEAAVDREGKLLAIRGHLRHDHGATTPSGLSLPQNSATNLIGPYVLPAYRLEVSLCLTNLVAATSTRGAGRTQGTFVMERLLDRIADELGFGRDEVRRRNLITPQQMPYVTPVTTRDGLPMTYDSGDYPECQRRALAAAGWADFPARRERGPSERAAVRIGPSGKIFVTTGAAAQGQGTRTMLAQLAAGVLGVRPGQIHVTDGDTAASPLGLGAYASRQAVTAGNAVHLAALMVADKARRAASTMLEVAADDLELVDGEVRLKGVPQMKRTLAEVAHALSGVPGFALPGNMAPGLAAAADFQPPALTYTNGAHVVEAEVDSETGGVRLTRYVLVHDCGRMINPMMVEGQVHGAVVHGIGATLLEWMLYDRGGQPLTVSFADYLLPTVDVVPPIEIHHMESPTPLNPLGVKGAAESGTIGAPAAIVSAIEDALRPLKVRIRELPVTPARLRALIQAATHA